METLGGIMFYLVCYDIVSDKKRAKIAKTLESLGMRVQKSVFECILDDKEYKQLSEKLLRMINKKEDQLRFYPLTESCRSKVKVLGIQPDFSVDDSAFII